MYNELVMLRNTLMKVETKGESTLIMADCIRFVDQMIAKCDAEKTVPAETAEA